MKDYRYEIIDSELHLLDKELGLDIRAPFTPQMLPDPLREGEGVVIDEERGEAYCFEGQGRSFYPNGRIRSEFYSKGGNLHGPSRHYSEQGELACESWFVEGKRQGRRITPTSLERFVEGERHGKQEFFTANKKVRSQIEYSHGKLHGLTSLYYPNGQLKREIGFRRGKREGLERMWSEGGTLILEATFADDHLTGTSKRWFPAGTLAEELVYHSPFQKHDRRQWDEGGALRLEGLWTGERYLEKWWDASNELLQERHGKWEGKLVFE